MTVDLHQRLHDIALRQGKEPIDGTRIEGFGDGNAPAPASPEFEIESAAESYGPPIETPAPAPPPPPKSPLVEMGLRADRRPDGVTLISKAEGVFTPRVLQGAIVKEAELWIRDEEATYKGRAVRLTSQEQQALARIVVRALKRDLAQLEVGGSRVRRRAAVSAASRKEAPATGSASSSPRPRKPRGSLLNRQGPMKP